MQRWIELTSLNGVIDLYEARKSLCGFSIWTLIVTSMSVLCVYSTYNTIVGYVNSPTITTITTVPSVTMPMPDILLCYIGGYNGQKMKHDMGLSHELIKHFTKAFYGLMRNTKEYQEADEIELNNYLKVHKIGISQFYNEISYDCDDIIETISIAGRLNAGGSCVNVSKKFVDYYMPGSCLLLENNGNQSWPGPAGSVHMVLKEPNGSLHETYPDQLPSGFMLDFSKKFAGPTLKAIKILMNVQADVVLKATHHKRLTNCYKDATEESNSNDCFRSCYKKALVNNCNCVTAIDQILSNETVCSIFDYYHCSKRVLTILAALTQCTTSCTAVCSEWEYEYTMSLNEDISSHTKRTIINIGFNSLQYIKEEEIQAFTIDMAVGNVGGVAGLYLGCSMMTFIQFFYYLVLHFINRKTAQNTDSKKIVITMDGIRE